MKQINIAYRTTQVSCACGNSFTTRSTAAPQIKTEVCANCHPFYTGQGRQTETPRPIARFQAKYAHVLGHK